MKLFLLGVCAVASLTAVSPALAEVVPGEFLVTYRPGSSVMTSTSQLDIPGAEVIKVFRKSDTYLIRSPGHRAGSFERWLSRLPEVVHVQPNFRYHATFTPNDPSFVLQWNLAKINMPAAWDADTTAPLYGGDPSIVVAVLDTGVAFENFGPYVRMPEFSSTNFVSGTDFINGDDHPNDDLGHGTHVTATIVQGTNNSSAGAGIAFNASIMPIKVLDSAGIGTTAEIAAGVDYARTHGADVINLSLGGASDDPVLHAAITAAANAGIVIVAAAGNNASSSLLYPARYDEVVAVAATRFDDSLAPYSNRGPGLDLSAPGGDLDVDQNSDGQPDGILQQTCVTAACASFAEVFYEGTSQATPHVSAAAALLLSAGVPSANVASALMASASDLGSAGYDTTYGWGRLNVQAALSVGLNDTGLPSGNVVINQGQAATGNSVVELTLAASDAVGAVVAMSFSNDASTFSAWEPYTTTRSAWDLQSTSDGTKTVFARFRDGAGNVSVVVSDSILLDRTPPPTFAVRGHAPAPHDRVLVRSGVATAVKQLVAEWDQPTDALSGVVGYRVVLNGSKSASLTTGTLSDQATYTSPIMDTGRTRYLHVGAVDAAGNVRVITFKYNFRPTRFLVGHSTDGRGILGVHTTTGRSVRRITVVAPSTQAPAVTGVQTAFGDPERIAVNGPVDPTTVQVLRENGQRLFSFTPSGAFRPSAIMMASGNLTGDGRSEIVVAPANGKFPLRVFSHQGKLLRAFWPFGTEYAGGMDVAVIRTATGVRIAAAQRTGQARVRILTLSGQRIRQFTPFSTGFGAGARLGSGDIDGDGLDELLITPEVGRAVVRIFSSTGVRLRTFTPYSSTLPSGVDLTTGDIDGDGDAEIAVIPRSGAGHVKLLNDQAQTLKTWFAPSRSYRGPLTITSLR